MNLFKIKRRYLIAILVVAAAGLANLVYLIAGAIRYENPVTWRLECQNPHLRGRSRLHFACAVGNVDEVRMLLDRGMDPNVASEEGLVPLHCLLNAKISSAALEECLRLMLAAGADLNRQNRHGSSPIHWAIYDTGSLAAILAAKVNVDVQDKAGRTPLHLVARLTDRPWYPSAELTRMLLQAGANPSIKDADGSIPLDIAKTGRVKEVVDLLKAAIGPKPSKSGEMPEKGDKPDAPQKE